MPIGEFSRLTGLSVKALRHYDDLGLLRPAVVDPDTGYRWYAGEQVRVALRVRLLRELDLPLGEIKRLLSGADQAELLRAHRERVAARARRDQQIVNQLERLISGEEQAVPEDVLYRIEVKELPAQELAVIRERVATSELAAWLRHAFEELFACAGGVGAGPPFAVLPPPDEEDVVEVEAALPLAGEVVVSGRVTLRHDRGFRALVALHRGSYASLPQVHRALWNALHDQDVQPAGPPREIYLTNPDEVSDPSQNLTEVVWPLAAGAEWRPSDELFTKPLSSEYPR
jgi:DNA-binding transcriptional MerR regulator